MTQASRAHAKTMRRAPTEAEQKLWGYLRSRRLSHLKFRRQVPLGPYIVDFICFARKLIVEADGSQHAENPYDATRNAWLAAHGFQILRLWNTDILNDREGCLDTILAKAGERW